MLAGSKMEDNIFLDWPTRFNIFVGIARGLVYLHEDLQPCIIHRDIKASNILLDNNLNAKIADFGLARLFSDDQSQLFTQIAGTIGYMSPEYATLGQLSTKVDVYSFGILLLEIISGRKAILQNATTNMYLVEWVRTFDYLVFNPFKYIYFICFSNNFNIKFRSCNENINKIQME
jgi:serine/threonine protein kinase